eukprot:4563363-Prymnesium_polylepis.1
MLEPPARGALSSAVRLRTTPVEAAARPALTNTALDTLECRRYGRRAEFRLRHDQMQARAHTTSVHHSDRRTVPAGRGSGGRSYPGGSSAL